MKEIKISIESLFQKISKLKEHSFEKNKEFEISSLGLQTLSETNERINITHLIEKTDSLIKFVLESGKETIVANEHLFAVSSELCVMSNNLKIGDCILTKDGLEKIVSMEIFEEESTVYDITVDSENHLYQTANGIVHHNTSFMKSLSTLTGVPLVVIEAPHITAEHIINIPFLVIDGQKTKTGNIALDDRGGDLKVVQAESNLVTQLKTMSQVSDEERLARVNKNPQLKEIFNSPDIQRRLMGIDGMFSSILFLDEYFRTASKQIKNVLRNILNGKIGNDTIPDGVYIIMASNVDDEGVDEIPENYDFHMMRYESPSKDDFFSYIKSKYVAEVESDNADDEDYEETPSGIKMKPEVFNNFYDVMNDGIFGSNDEQADVRLSPRRVEQMLTYIDAMTPVKSVEEIRALYTFVNTNLSNYLTGDLFKGASEVMGAVKKIIAETSPDFADKLDVAPFTKADWKETLSHEIEAKLRLGENRSYLPVISGDPGIGKTSIAKSISKEKNMGLICIDVSNLKAEDFVGLPIADTSGEEITTKFSEPNLYNFIMKQYNQIIEEFRQPGRPYNVLLLIDEISRTTPSVFNAMRKLLLEKEFSDEYKLPLDVMIMGALNPSGELTTELTSHSRDVLDIISATAKFSDVMTYATGREEVQEINETLGFSASETIGNIFTSIAREFQTTERPDTGEKLSQEEAPFWWEVNGEVFYISGREYTEALANTAAQLEDRLLDMDWDANANYSDEDYESFMQEALNVTANTFGLTLNMVVTKMKITNFVPTFIGKVTQNAKYKDAFKVMKERKGSEELPLDELYKKAGRDINFISKKLVGSYLRYTSTPTQFGQDYSRMLSILFEDHKTNEVASVIMNLAKNMKIIFDELDYPEAVQNAYTDIMLQMTKGQIISLIESPNIGLVILEADSLINAILEVF